MSSYGLFYGVDGQAKKADKIYIGLDNGKIARVRRVFAGDETGKARLIYFRDSIFEFTADQKLKYTDSTHNETPDADRFVVTEDTIAHSSNLGSDQYSDGVLRVMMGSAEHPKTMTYYTNSASGTEFIITFSEDKKSVTFNGEQYEFGSYAPIVSVLITKERTEKNK